METAKPKHVYCEKLLKQIITHSMWIYTIVSKPIQFLCYILGLGKYGWEWNNCAKVGTSYSICIIIITMRHCLNEGALKGQGHEIWFG